MDDGLDEDAEVDGSAGTRGRLAFDADPEASRARVVERNV